MRMQSVLIGAAVATAPTRSAAPAPVRRVAALDTFVAYQPIVEDVILPQPERIFHAIADLIKY